MTADAEIIFDSRSSRDTAPEVSLIIPVYNVRDFVDQCLASVWASAASMDLEVIIIDDGSQDGSREWIAQHLAERQPEQTLFLTQANQGLSAVRNRGVGLATGEYLGFLDSDDLLTTGVMRQLLDFARQHRCDLVLGKSLVFDSKTHLTYPFYDDWAWQRLLGSQEVRVVSRHEDPALFFLEPNANYRLLRRELFDRFNLHYPEGRLFEDPPVHYKMLARAHRVGLVGIPYYWYRVNRPGKITAERSLRRFDILEVAHQTFAELGPLDITPEAGAAILYGLSRIVWWCGTMTLPEHRHDYFQKAAALFAEQAPAAWVDRFGTCRFPDEIHHLIVSALIHREVSQLWRLSYGQRKPLRSMMFLLKIGRRDLILRRLRMLLGAWRRRLRKGH